MTNEHIKKTHPALLGKWESVLVRYFTLLHTSHLTVTEPTGTADDAWRCVWGVWRNPEMLWWCAYFENIADSSKNIRQQVHARVEERTGATNTHEMVHAPVSGILCEKEKRQFSEHGHRLGYTRGRALNWQVQGPGFDSRYNKNRRLWKRPTSIKILNKQFMEISEARWVC